MEGHKDAVRTHETEPEMNSPPSFIHHPPSHLGKPEISSGEDAKHRGDSHHHVEVPDYEVRRMQHDVDRWLRQEESAHSAGDKHRNKTQGKQRSRVDTQPGAIQTEHPNQNNDR